MSIVIQTLEQLYSVKRQLRTPVMFKGLDNQAILTDIAKFATSRGAGFNYCDASNVAYASGRNRPGWMPEEDDEDCILCLSTINLARETRCVNLLMEATVEKKLGAYKLPPECQIVATMATQPSPYWAIPLDSAFLARFAIINVE